MIKADLEKTGVIQVTGRSDYIMAEYTIVTKIIIHQLIDDFGEEKGLKILAMLGRIAAEKAEDLGNNDTKDLFNKIDEVFNNEI